MTPAPRLVGWSALCLVITAATACDILWRDDDVPLHGLDFGPYVEGEDPSAGAQVSRDQLYRLGERLVGRADWLRTYGTDGGLEHAASVARELGFQTAVGSWLGRSAAANEREIEALIAIANAGDVDLAIVGSETLLRGDLTGEELVAYIERVRAAIPAGIPVTTAEDCEKLLRDANVLDAVDVVLFNYHPYFEGHDASCAVSGLHSCYTRLGSAVGSKPIMVSETGWPTCGNTILGAVPSEEEASRYLINFISWAQATATPYFYFEAFDEPWKSKYEGPQGGCWGIWSSDGALKGGMEEAFSGRTVLDNWSNPSVPGGPGTPEIEFTSVPALGSFEDLEGIVRHARPTDYRVVVFVYVGGYWIKPYRNQPLTAITCSGRWRVDVTTGGIDEQATRLVAYLVPYGYDPPLLAGAPLIPDELERVAVAKVELIRTPSE